MNENLRTKLQNAQNEIKDKYKFLLNDTNWVSNQTNITAASNIFLRHINQLNGNLSDNLATIDIHLRDLENVYRERFRRIEEIIRRHDEAASRLPPSGFLDQFANIRAIRSYLESNDNATRMSRTSQRAAFLSIPATGAVVIEKLCNIVPFLSPTGIAVVCIIGIAAFIAFSELINRPNSIDGIMNDIQNEIAVGSSLENHREELRFILFIRNVTRTALNNSVQPSAQQQQISTYQVQQLQRN